MKRTLALTFLACSVLMDVSAQDAAFQIRTATAAAPEHFREGAAVLGYGSDGEMGELRRGTNNIVCIADSPGDDRFHVACYHKSLEPFMSRGRQLRADGMTRQEIQEQREAEIKNGMLALPTGPAVLYSLSASAEDVSMESGDLSAATPLYVVYIPYATPESTGLSTDSAPGVPWLMNPGKPWAHIMMVPRAD